MHALATRYDQLRHKLLLTSLAYLQVKPHPAVCSLPGATCCRCTESRDALSISVQKDAKLKARFEELIYRLPGLKIEEQEGYIAGQDLQVRGLAYTSAQRLSRGAGQLPFGNGHLAAAVWQPTFAPWQTPLAQCLADGYCRTCASGSMFRARLSEVFD